jgi:nitric oxide reductase large subunit
MATVIVRRLELHQFGASVAHGLWCAPGESFLQQDRLVTLRLLRTLGYVIFIIGRLCFS